MALSATNEEPLPSLMERFAVPSDGRFAECLRQAFLLNAVRDCPLGEEIPALAEIESLKSERASSAQPMGAAALQIMVQRVAKEGGRKWSGDWRSGSPDLAAILATVAQLGKELSGGAGQQMMNSGWRNRASRD